MNLKRYKRFFAFGCSMTEYNWPTWADLIATEFDESYNYGKSGGGNLFISNQVVEANKVHKLNKDDLVIIMWSSISREDRYKNNYWHTPGNIYSQGEIPMKFVEKWADSRFYLLRDMAFIELTQKYLDSIGCEWHMLNMAPFVDIQHHVENHSFKHGQDILDLYEDTLLKIEPDICTVVFDGIWPVIEIKGYGGEPYDYHPTPLGHLSYLRKIFPTMKVTDSMKEMAKKYSKLIEDSESVVDVVNEWTKEKKHLKGRL